MTFSKMYYLQWMNVYWLKHGFHISYFIGNYRRYIVGSPWRRKFIREYNAFYLPVITDNGYRRDELRDTWKPGVTMTNLHSYCQEAHNLPFLEMLIINNANILKWLTYPNIRYPLQRSCHYMCICRNLDG